MTPCPLLDDEYLTRRYNGQPTNIPFLLRANLSRIAKTLRSRQYDLLWVEKELLPWIPEFLEKSLLMGKSYVLDFDDAIYHTYDQHPNPLVRRLIGGKIQRLMRDAALVVVGNEYLAKQAREAGAMRVEEVPSVIDLNRYGLPAPLPNGPFTIGWIGSPGSERLLEHIRGVLADMVRQPGVRLVLVGASSRALAGVPHETWAWSEAEEINHLRRFHVGIMPLGETLWERGKCGYKLIQCMGAGRAVVASPVGVNKEIVEDGATGFLASSKESWRRAFHILKENWALCERQGKTGRKKAENHYDLAITAPKVIELLKSVQTPERRRRGQC
jgi:glycosyltransferase involved in cell wall biosynthesis